jgi:hypothetical protein
MSMVRRRWSRCDCQVVRAGAAFYDVGGYREEYRRNDLLNVSTTVKSQGNGRKRSACFAGSTRRALGQGASG